MPLGDLDLWGLADLSSRLLVRSAAPVGRPLCCDPLEDNTEINVSNFFPMSSLIVGCGVEGGCSSTTALTEDLDPAFKADDIL